jgi:hypothetical protein
MDNFMISKRPYAAAAVTNATTLAYSVQAISIVDDVLVNVPLIGFLMTTQDFDTWQVPPRLQTSVPSDCY